MDIVETKKWTQFNSHMIRCSFLYYYFTIWDHMSVLDKESDNLKVLAESKLDWVGPIKKLKNYM